MSEKQYVPNIFPFLNKKYHLFEEDYDCVLNRDRYFNSNKFVPPINDEFANFAVVHILSEIAEVDKINRSPIQSNPMAHVYGSLKKLPNVLTELPAILQSEKFPFYTAANKTYRNTGLRRKIIRLCSDKGDLRILAFLMKFFTYYNFKYLDEYSRSLLVAMIYEENHLPTIRYYFKQSAKYESSIELEAEKKQLYLASFRMHEKVKYGQGNRVNTLYSDHVFGMTRYIKNRLILVFGIISLVILGVFANILQEPVKEIFSKKLQYLLGINPIILVILFLFVGVIIWALGVILKEVLKSDIKDK